MRGTDKKIILLYGAVAVALLTGTYGITVGIRTERISLNVSLSANQTATPESDRHPSDPARPSERPASEKDHPLTNGATFTTLSPVEVQPLLTEDSVYPRATPAPASALVTLKPIPTRATTIADELTSPRMASEIVQIERRCLLASGNASITTNQFTVPKEGDWKFSISYSGTGRFEIKLREEVSSKDTILAYALGAFHSEKNVQLTTSGKYRLIISGSGEWSIKAL